ncbi:MAG: hypothetical protein Q8M88_07235 [Phenylobacterium sp.]|uniref:hypothetical protein n=1 Tax=Phenylobacterium sp. TaxID=1871053 RepID=UPI002735C555|nr:hypothetical protein [Phenylobacterium sp.]MDP3174211.1 hypothetical protein [Phenylobacterium sp.]
MFLYNINNFEWVDAWRLFAPILLIHLGYVALAITAQICAVAALVRSQAGSTSLRDLRTRISTDVAAQRLVIALAYALLATATVVLGGKSGANINYTNEWMITVGMFAGLGLNQAAAIAFRRSAVRQPVQWAAVWLSPIAIALQPLVLLDPTIPTLAPDDRQAKEVAHLSEMVRHAKAPIISDDTVLLLRNGKAMQWETFIFTELARAGRYDERGFVRMVRDKKFAFFVTEGAHGDVAFEQRYSPAVIGAMSQAYPLTRRMGRYTVHLPVSTGSQLPH